ncbi:MAG: SDR family oxidoreductase [Holophagales bacterium]|nr:SDR family oxidoreductase [Holophagales bacterium]
MSPYRDRIALVTGGAGGIGLAVGRAIAQVGGVVIFADIRAEKAEAEAEALRAGGARAEALALDVSGAKAFEGAVEGVVARHGRLDYLFNNAGIGMAGEVRDMSLEAWNRILDVNLKGVVHGVHAAYPLMVRQGHGHIANTACVAGLVPFPMTTAYCASKHAVVGLSTSLRAEAAAAGVRVSVICPGVVATEMFDHIEYFQVDKQALLRPVTRAMVSPEHCARQILKGVARDRAVITVNAHAGLVWWLYRLAPRPFLGLTRLVFGRLRHRLRARASDTGTRAASPEPSRGGAAPPSP